jgi:hypothetical protein
MTEKLAIPAEIKVRKLRQHRANHWIQRVGEGRTSNDSPGGDRITTVQFGRRGKGFVKLARCLIAI